MYNNDNLPRSMFFYNPSIGVRYKLRERTWLLVPTGEITTDLTGFGRMAILNPGLIRRPPVYLSGSFNDIYIYNWISMSDTVTVCAFEDVVQPRTTAI